MLYILIRCFSAFCDKMIEVKYIGSDLSGK